MCYFQLVTLYYNNLCVRAQVRCCSVNDKSQNAFSLNQVSINTLVYKFSDSCMNLIRPLSNTNIFSNTDEAIFTDLQQ